MSTGTTIKTKIKALFATRLNNLLIERKITQTELARFLEVDKSTISAWKKGSRYPSPKKLDALCVFFRVESDYFGSLYKDDEIRSLTALEQILDIENLTLQGKPLSNKDKIKILHLAEIALDLPLTDDYLFNSRKYY